MYRSDLRTAMTRTREPERSVGRREYLRCAAVAAVAIGSGSRPAGSDSITPEDVLRRPPFPPTDVDLFVDAVYGEAPPLQPARRAPATETEVRRELRRILSNRFSGDPAAHDEAVSVYDDPRLVETVPDPRLRAGVVAVQGTLAEPALGAVLEGDVSAIRFAPFDADDAGVAAHVLHLEGGCELVEVNDRFRFEDVRLFAPTLLHELLHSDRSPSPTEELIAHALDALVAMEVLLETPELALRDTALVRWVNTDVMARLNGRDAEGRLRVLTARGNVFPGGLELEAFAEKVEGGPGHDTRGNGLLERVLRGATGDERREPRFDDETLAIVDRTQRRFTSDELVRLAELLRLDVRAVADRRGS